MWLVQNFKKIINDKCGKLAGWFGLPKIFPIHTYMRNNIGQNFLQVLAREEDRESSSQQGHRGGSRYQIGCSLGWNITDGGDHRQGPCVFGFPDCTLWRKFWTQERINGIRAERWNGALDWVWRKHSLTVCNGCHCRDSLLWFFVRFLGYEMTQIDWDFVVVGWRLDVVDKIWTCCSSILLDEGGPLWWVVDAFPVPEYQI